MTPLTAQPNEASQRALAIEDGCAAVAEWEAEHGPLSSEELERADETLDSGWALGNSNA
jgi:hypothetical protein